MDTSCIDTVLWGQVCDSCNGSAILKVMSLVIEILGYGVGIVGVIAITVVGIQYLTSAGSAEKAMKARTRLANMVIGMLVYVGLFGIYNFLMPTGKLGMTVLVGSPETCPAKQETQVVVRVPIEEDLPRGSTPSSSGVSGGTGDSGGSWEWIPSDGEATPSTSTDDVLEIHFISIGKDDDDTIIIHSKDGSVLVDGGTADGRNPKSSRSRVKAILSFLEKRGITKLDYLIGSHLDANHVEAQGFLTNYDIGLGSAFYPVHPSTCPTSNPTWCEKKAKNSLINGINDGLKVRIPVPGTTRFRLGKLDVFFIGTRQDDFHTSGWYPENTTSIINILRYGSKTFMLTGDQAKMNCMNAKKNCDHNNYSDLKEDAAKFGFSSLHVDVFKWPHHGNSLSFLSKGFWQDINPSYIMVTNNGRSGKNDYPVGTAKEYQEAGAPNAKVYKLSNNDTVTFVTDGTNLDVVTNTTPEQWVSGGSFENGKWKFK